MAIIFDNKSESLPWCDTQVTNTDLLPRHALATTSHTSDLT